MPKTNISDNVRYLNLDLFNDWELLFAPDPVADENPTWSEQDILRISECLLQDSLRNLFDGRCSVKTAIEIYKWMTDINDPNPFSFINCCKLTGLDHDEIRDSIIFRLEKTRRLSHLH